MSGDPSPARFGLEPRPQSRPSFATAPRLTTTAPLPTPSPQRSRGSGSAHPGSPVSRPPSSRLPFDESNPAFAPNAAPLLGRYRVMELKDVGGFGSVLVCWDVRLQRRVAVKCLPLEIGAAAVTLDEALAEARASSFLTHPNIVTVHDFEVEGPWAYLVMEYVDGVTLAELIQRVEGGALIFDEVAYLVQCLASALEFAHRHGVLHLDIKPQNVLIDRSGQIKLGDFGMASLASAAGWGGARGGTVGYMAPEQLKGETVDERSDVFSFAVVIYEALCGSSPFMAPTAQDSLALIEAGAPPIGERESELSAPVARALMEALTPTMANREASVERLAQRLLSGRPAASLPTERRPLRATSFEDELPGEPLGDPERGLASLKRLLSQTQDSEDAFDEAPWKSLDPPARRIPHLASLCARAANAAATLWFLLLASQILSSSLGPQLALGTQPLASFWGIGWPFWLLALIGGGAAALWAPAGSAVALGCGVAAVCVRSFATLGAAPGLAALAQASAPALGLLAGSLVWWFWVGKRLPAQSLGAAALFAPAALGAPELAAALGGYALRPLQAALTGAASCALGITMGAAAAAQASAPVLFAASFASEFVALPSTQPLCALLAGAWSGPAPWVLVGASALGAFLAAQLGRLAQKRLREGRAGARILCGLGQVVATVCAAGGIVAAKGLENGGIYASPRPVTLGILLGSLALMLIITALFGPAQLSLARTPSGAPRADAQEDVA